MYNIWIMLKNQFILYILLIESILIYSASLETRHETRGITSYLKDKSNNIYNKMSDKVVSVMENQLLKLAKRIEDTCESEIQDEKIIPTEQGKTSCHERCKRLPKKIQNALLTVASKLPAMFGNGKLFTIVPAENYTNLQEYECVPNMTYDKLLCNCPRASHFYLSEEAQKELGRFLAGQNNSRELVLGGLLILVLAFCFTPIWVPILLITSPIWFPLVAGFLAFG